MAELYRYAAFISYSSKDAPFARRLHQALERYGIPSSLGAFDIIGGGKKNRIYPVFRDREELSAGQLGEQIEANLRASAALIVICSPNGAASPWVQKEIEFFASLDRHAKIFAIIPDNAPLVDEQGADCTQACFPPAFRGDALSGDKLEPLAADARKGKDGFRNAWLKIVAGMVGVTPGQIIDRDRKRRSEQRIRLALGGVAAVAALAVAGAAIDARAAREGMSARAMVLTGEGHPFDAIPFAVAGLPMPGDLWALPHRDARAALERTSGVGVIVDLGRLVDTPDGFGFSGDSRFLLKLDADGNGALIDLRQPTAPPRALGPVRRGFGFRFSADGNYLATRDANDVGVLRDLREPDAEPQPLGSVAGFSFSPDGRFLATRAPDGVTELRDLSNPAVVPRSLGQLRDLIFSADGRFVLALDQDIAGSLINLRDADVAPRRIGRLTNHGFSNDGRFLLIREPTGVGTLYDLQDPAIATRPLGRLFEYGGFGFSDDGRFLMTRDQNVVATVRDLRNPAAAPRALELFSLFGFSGDGRFLLTLNEDGVGVLRDLPDERSEPRSLGHMTSFAFSRDGRFLMTYDQGVADSGLLYDLSNIDGAPRRLGALTDFDISQDGRFMVTQNESEAALHDLQDANASLRTLGPIMDFGFSEDGRFLVTRDYEYGGALRDTSVKLSGGAPGASFCSASDRAVRPFARRVRENRSDSLFPRLEGRPWNPCDWRGLFAIFPDASRGGGWFEGARQWLRLMRVRYFDGRDYACAETTSAASVETRESRRDMCERFAPAQEAT